MTQAPFPEAAPPSRRPDRPGPGLGVSIGLLVAGLVIGIVAAVAISIPLVGTFTSRSYNAPTRLSLSLEDARYTVFERSGSTSGLGFNAGPVTIGPSEVTVTAPDGQPVFVFVPSSTETITRDSDVYTSAVQFDAPTSGVYDIRLSTPTPTRVLITRSLGDTVRSVVGWFGVGAIGGIVMIAGLVMLIVGITRRSRARRATQVGWGQPAWGQPAYGQPQWGQPQWGQQQWGQPQPYAPAPPPPPYPPPAPEPPAPEPPAPEPPAEPSPDPWRPQ